jgi:hypothetical protein
MTKLFSYLLIIILLGTVFSCRQEKNKQRMGTYGYDKNFLRNNNVDFIELKSTDNQSRLLIVHGYQGRVMTSTAGGEEGKSYGWINYKFIEAGKRDPQFNVYGGEERFWLGPEGGPFSIYFRPGDKQVYENWSVPEVIDTEAYNIEYLDSITAKFKKDAVLWNASGTEFIIGIERTITLLSKREVQDAFNISISESIQMVAYQTENEITNLGSEPWTKDKGLLSIWMLSMFNPSPETIEFIPYNPDTEGPIVNDEYFGKVPSDRLKIDSNVVYFKIDGKFRSKIGVPANRAKELCGSYDSGSKVLTILWYSLPEESRPYVNSIWGDQADSYNGDVVNSYNDGPVEDGTIMGPFYEIETSSPAAELKPSESLKHIQKIIHFQGEENDLAKLAKSLLAIDLESLQKIFN